MQTVSKADSRGRVVLRGAQNGHRYVVTRTAEGWFVTPEPPSHAKKPVREWAGPKVDLSAHLEAMAAEGFTMEPLKLEAWPCRF